MTELISEANSFLEAAGYLRGNLLSDYRYTWRSPIGHLRNDRAHLVAFSDEPHTMTTACVGVLEAESDDAAHAALRRLVFLSTPLALVGTPDAVTLWALRREQNAEQLVRSARANWQSVLTQNYGRLSPDVIAEAKRTPRQLSFVDAGLAEWAERITGDALVTLLEQLLTETFRHVPGDVRRTKSGADAVLRLVFHLFACRVLEDRDIIPASDDIRVSLRAASERFSENIDPEVINGLGISEAAVTFVLQTLRERFAFASLTPSMLGHAYENALVTPSFRKQRGIYYTPVSLTRYVLNKTPIESIPESDRRFLDPACGSGSFLLAAYDRLERLLPRTMTRSERHQYLRARLYGFDIDHFAQEMAVLSLLLTDVDNRNGWKVKEGDLFDIAPTTTGGKRPSIIITNPPFGEVKVNGTRRELAADAASHLLELLAPGGFIGIVLPLSIADSRAGEATRREILKRCDLIEVLTSPDGLFHSRAEGLTLIGRKHSNQRPSVSVTTVRELKARDLGRFHQAAVFTRTYSLDVDRWKSDPSARFVISPLLDLWERLESTHLQLNDVAEISAGIKLKAGDETSLHDERIQPGDVPFLNRKDVLKPFALLTKVGRPQQWLTYGPHLERARTPETFAPAKVLVNSTRDPGSPWRLVAAMAPPKLFYSFNFHGIVPSASSSISLEVFAAILNSPLANAWFDAHSRKRWVHVPTLGRLPIPRIDVGMADRITSRVKFIEQATIRKWNVIARSHETLFDEDNGASSTELSVLITELDEIVFTAYGLTVAERRAVQKVMAGEKRPGQ